MNREEQKALVEAILFIENEPVEYKKILTTLEITQEELAPLVDELRAEYEVRQAGLQIVEVAGGYQMMAHPRFSLFLSRLYGAKNKAKLSQSTLEVLAIIAYRQPITKPEIEDIRGVSCDRVIKLLLEKEMIAIVGKRETPGRPIEFGTTKNFLRTFGLKSLKDLPQLREIKDREFIPAGEGGL